MATGDDDDNGDGAMGDGVTGYDNNDDGNDGDDKEIDGVGTWRSFQGGTIKASSSRELRGPQRMRGHRGLRTYKPIYRP